ncbi:MAG: winged helix-turn-helix transcriptional regulator [Candidatus Aminicenantes bacterium]|nr:winged helix-turn-helix transcriptional regulator [Candidatus Aminicenantes bacterium]
MQLKKKDFYTLHSNVCKTLANPKRQEILDSLRERELTVNQIVEKTGISQANLSQHLAIMRSKGIVKSRREGINVYYSLANTKIIEAFDLISQLINESLASQTKTVEDAIGKKA